MMKPYPQKGLTTEKRVFNYILSKMRRISENEFGILRIIGECLDAHSHLNQERLKLLHLLLLHFIIGYEKTLVMVRVTFLLS